MLRNVIPPIVGAFYVRPNEISIERPFIQRHIEATRSAFGIDRPHQRGGISPRKPDERIDFKQHQPLLDNVRLWDWHAFHDAITQLQPYRPYIYTDTDVDRYTINGQLRQMMLSPRELDLTQLGEAGARWINPHFIYTHGYGIVMAEANTVSPNGLPELIIKDAPPVISLARAEAHAPRALLRRERARPGVRRHRASRIRLSFRRPQRGNALRGQRRISRFPRC